MTTKRLNVWSIVVDFLLLITAYCITMLWLPLTNEEPFDKYNGVFIIFSGLWILSGLLNLKYRNEKEILSVWIFRSLFSAVIITLFFLIFLPFFRGYNFSMYVLLAIPTITLFLEITYLSIRDTFKSAKNKEEKNENISVELLPNLVNEQLFQFLSKRIPLEEEALNILNNSEVLSVFHLENKKYFLQLDRFNRVKKLNLFLAIVNSKLNYKGLLVGSFETKNARKKRILSSSFWGWNYVLYGYDYLYKRFFPGFYLTSSLFSLFYTKTDRVFSKTEMYGRLYCAGFEFVEDCKIDGTTWFVFRKTGKPQRYEEKFAGSLIGLNRIGKGGKMFVEYKFRTMYPYSEYLQTFMIQTNKLREGGKINRDIRVTRIGTIFRRFWIDELPQFINLLRGDVKLVGVRPLSVHYFALYRPELQQLRIKHKPGLLPPFYADMPKTLDEIQDSELAYLRLCEEKGVLRTDISYFIRILSNILLKKARSK